MPRLVESFAHEFLAARILKSEVPDTSADTLLAA